jgi:large subunit ribosomal protein L24
MPKQKKLHVKIGDSVRILSGFHKNEVGEVLKINKKTGKILIKGINFKFKHIKPNTDNEIGEIKQIEAPIHHSNVTLNLNEVS